MKYAYVVMLNDLPVACFSHAPTKNELRCIRHTGFTKLAVNEFPKESCDDDSFLAKLADVDPAAAYILTRWLPEYADKIEISANASLSQWLFCRFPWVQAPLGYMYWDSIHSKLKEKGL